MWLKSSWIMSMESEKYARYCNLLIYIKNKIKQIVFFLSEWKVNIRTWSSYMKIPCAERLPFIVSGLAFLQPALTNSQFYNLTLIATVLVLGSKFCLSEINRMWLEEKCVSTLSHFMSHLNTKSTIKIRITCPGSRVSSLFAYPNMILLLRCWSGL